jgi:hypothetical protein
MITARQDGALPGLAMFLTLIRRFAYEQKQFRFKGHGDIAAQRA